MAAVRPMRAGALWAGVLAVVGACGDDLGVPLELRFANQVLECTGPDMQAYLQVLGVDGVCPLTVNEDRTVSGVCEPVPLGAVRDFRVTYFYEIAGERIDLAIVTEQVDLRGETRETIVLEFKEENLVIDFDDDRDGRVNIEEFCSGTDPRIPD